MSFENKIDNIIPVILCGGSGTRLWPVSRKDYPKQFTNLVGDISLFPRYIETFGSCLCSKASYCYK